jgi:hypothetical protein
MSKADYVRSAPDPGGHVCHWPGCTSKVPPAMWGCRKHWYTLPIALRNKVWRAYSPGQELSKRPSPEYLAVAREVEAWIAEHQARQAAGRLL